MILFKNYWTKINCLIGKHEWSYHNEYVPIRIGTLRDPNLSSVICNLSTRFCNSCYKKQIRQRHDMNLYYIDGSKYEEIIPLTDDQRRIKNLNTLLDS